MIIYSILQSYSMIMYIFVQNNVKKNPMYFISIVQHLKPKSRMGVGCPGAWG